ncbi:MAG TPA: DUF1338 domain-containing protein [Spongiibacteraceae bacterium]|nr:DUF1338 domain-containing protein [Spongiibacteraceae bacterium]MBN51643.1 DUF1338 domain-containing protein [Spongiibacteraceae bacterium]HCS28562.1 DUF1338 domain-containing protein [Spongiibacteraceae bacterium]
MSRVSEVPVPETNPVNGIYRLLERVVGRRNALELCSVIVVPASVNCAGKTISRAELAQALNMVLYHDLLAQVPEALLYLADKRRRQEKIFLDHGAVRSVLGVPTGELPGGREAFTRFLEPLGYRQAETYDLSRIRMTGYAYCHCDYPEDIAQFFISELDVQQFSVNFQAAATSVFASSIDPLSDEAKQILSRLALEKALSFADAVTLLASLRACFERQHNVPRLQDYRTLKAESVELAWIATEGSAYNHVTDRVANVENVSEVQRQLGRPVKDTVEIASFGSVRQSAYRATSRQRLLLDDDGAPELHVLPGSFIEFISRDRIGEGANKHLDLRFDAGNAQGIFKMTASGIGQFDLRKSGIEK